MTDDADREARAMIEGDLDTSLFVEASAGTGKTTALVRRYVALVRGGADVRRMGVVTFTDKAAGELKLRIRVALEALASQAPTPSSATDAIDNLEDAPISTIHGFAADLLRTRPAEAGVDPKFTVLSAEEAEGHLRAVFDRWLEGELADPESVVHRAFCRESVTVEALFRGVVAHVESRAADGSWAAPERPLELMLEEVRQALFAFSEKLQGHVASAPRLRADFADLEGLVRSLETESPWNVEARCVENRRVRFDAKPPRSNVYSPALRADLASVTESLRAFAEGASAHLAFLLHRAMAEVGARYDEEKCARGAVDFNDLVSRSRELLVRHPEELDRLRAHFTHLFVDELQDTDRPQLELLGMLASTGHEVALAAMNLAPGKLFVVGDPKQSIYGFRNVDPNVHRVLQARIEASGGRTVHLSRSFRVEPPLAPFINHAFESHLYPSPSSALVPARRGSTDRPAVIGLPIPKPYRFRLHRDEVAASTAHAIAGYIDWLLHDSGWDVRDERTGERVPIAPHHIAVLFRQTTSRGVSLLAPLAKALSERGIASQGDRWRAHTPEIHGLICALRAIEAPSDPATLVAALRGAAFGFSDETILEWMHRYGRIDPLVPPVTALPESLVPMSEALSLIVSLRRLRNHRAPAETLAALVHGTSLSPLLGLSQNPGQGFADLARLERWATAHERDSGSSFLTFVESLGARDLGPSVGDDDDEAPGVRMVTVHASKGLEYPVVILGDPTTEISPSVDRVFDPEDNLSAFSFARLTPIDVLRRADAERARSELEGYRCAYVAATRARDQLVVPIVGDDVVYPARSWLRPILTSLKVALESPPEGDPMTGEDLVLERPFQAEWIPESGRRAAPFDCLFFPPSKLLPHRAPPPAVWVDLISKKVEERIVRDDEARVYEFLARRSALREDAAVRPFKVTTATARSLEELPSTRFALRPAVVVDRPEERSSGPRFGNLVHALLSLIPWDVSEAELHCMARHQGAPLGSTDAEIHDAAQAVLGFLAHPSFDLVRSARSVYRELPLTYLEIEPPTRSSSDDGENRGAPAGGVIVDGVMDLLLELPDEWLVIDYKTDRPTSALAKYERQVRLYCEGVSRRFKKSATGLLVFL